MLNSRESKRISIDRNNGQYSVTTYMGKESKKSGYIYTCATDSLCCTADTEHCKTTKLIKILKRKNGEKKGLEVYIEPKKMNGTGWRSVKCLKFLCN